jgi:hypothetical protein
MKAGPGNSPGEYEEQAFVTELNLNDYRTPTTNPGRPGGLRFP